MNVVKSVEATDSYAESRLLLKERIEKEILEYYKGVSISDHDMEKLYLHNK